MTRSFKASIAAASAALTALAPAFAHACPQCAGKADGGIASALVLGAFVFFPFAVVGVVLKVVKHGERDDTAGPIVRRPFE